MNLLSGSGISGLKRNRRKEVMFVLEQLCLLHYSAFSSGIENLSLYFTVVLLVNYCKSMSSTLETSVLNNWSAF